MAHFTITVTIQLNFKFFLTFNEKQTKQKTLKMQTIVISKLIKYLKQTENNWYQKKQTTQDVIHFIYQKCQDSYKISYNTYSKSRTESKFLDFYINFNILMFFFTLGIKNTKNI